VLLAAFSRAAGQPVPAYVWQGVAKPPAAGFVPLFNGKDLGEWRAVGDPADAWQVRDGHVWGGGDQTSLVSVRKFLHFHLRMEFRVNLRGTATVLFRADPSDPALRERSFHPDGFEVNSGKLGAGGRRDLDVGLLVDGKRLVGSTAVGPFQADQWVTLDLVAQGDRLSATVGEHTVGIADPARRNQPGPLVLRLGGPDSVIEIRKIEVMELPPEPPRAVAPFDAAKAKELQTTWAKHLGVDVEVTNSVGMKLRLIPPGEVTMGSTDAEREAVRGKVHAWAVPAVEAEGPPHTALVPKAYYLGATEVTVGQFRTFVTQKGYQTTAEKTGKGGRALVAGDRIEQRPEWTWKHALWAADDDDPVVQVTLDDARAFCAWLTATEGVTYALPTEEQWEHACRAGTTTWWPTGNDSAVVLETDWVVGNSETGMHRVGRKRANPFGLYDLCGNAEELCDWEKDGKQVSRGGHANLEPWLCRSAARWTFAAGEPYYRRGFRVTVVGDLKATK